MRIHCLLNAENPGTYFPTWAASHGHSWECSLVPERGALPSLSEADCLVVMGGPMSAWEEGRHPWLSEEKRYLEKFIGAGKPVLGVCLGAQLIAEVLGARVYRGPHQEIGWFPVESTPEASQTWLGDTLPARFETFLWHGDTFELPDGAVRVARSVAYENQGFVWNRVMALQFHLEVRPEWVRMLVQRDGDQLVESAHVQSAKTVLGRPESLYQHNNVLIATLLKQWLESV